MSTIKSAALHREKVAFKQAIDEGPLHFTLWFGRNTLKWLFVLLIFVFTFGPILWLVLSSFKTNFELFSAPLSIPQHFGFNNYRKALALPGLGQTFLNTVVISGTTVLLCLGISAMAAYAMRYMSKGSGKVHFFLTLGIYIPVNAFMIPYTTMISRMHLYDTIWALILVYTATGLPLSIMVIRAYMDTIPSDLFEAAKIDGAGFLTTFFKIILPLSRPGLATIGIFQFFASWNEFLYAMLMTQSKARTLQISMKMFTTSFITDYSASITMVVICILPTIIAYVFFQNQIISGMTSGALKG